MADATLSANSPVLIRAATCKKRDSMLCRFVLPGYGHLTSSLASTADVPDFTVRSIWTNMLSRVGGSEKIPSKRTAEKVDAILLHGKGWIAAGSSSSERRADYAAQVAGKLKVNRRWVKKLIQRLGAHRDFGVRWFDERCVKRRAVQLSTSIPRLRAYTAAATLEGRHGI